ncbi:MAG: hypothetical protein ACRD43_08590, partial [Pyrinomonadaceae bacterium]
MKKLEKVLAAVFASILVVGGFSVEASAQRKNDRDVRDIVRSLNSKIDDFSSALSYQLKSSSADQQEMDDVITDLKDLKDSLNTFQT